LRLARRRDRRHPPPPLLVELFDWEPLADDVTVDRYPFRYSVGSRGGDPYYGVGVLLGNGEVGLLREVVADISERLAPSQVDPLTFQRLIEVLRQLAAEELAGGSSRVAETSELAAYEAVGLARVMALARDEEVTEFYVDSTESPVYLDHSLAGRCETRIMLTERERTALETHLDTFRGYTLDYSTPSLKNDMEIGGARLRVSLDLEPLAANRFSLDVRRLNLSSLPLEELIKRGSVSEEAASFLVAWLSSGGNVTIVGETGTGKTTLLNALDERLDSKLRRVYIEDAIETKDLIGLGYHQLKVKVDPFERADRNPRTKEVEIVKVLHRSPDLVILSEIQSEEHSRAFFHALAAGVRGMQTFHASSPEQAVRRWTTVHSVATESLADLGVLVQMGRPDRLKPPRIVTRICQLIMDDGEPRIRDIYLRDRSGGLTRVMPWERLSPPPGRDAQSFSAALSRAAAPQTGKAV
jgi:type IV secretory pathway ATPase VirB11/archaellum biosynthesis ATPase